jgi:Tfp pilus assembly protein PilF
MGKKKLRNRPDGNDAAPVRENPVEKETPREPATHKPYGAAYAAILASVTIFSFLIFIPALSGEFLGWDDNYFISDNARVRGPFNLAFLKWAFTDDVLGLWLPLTVISFGLDHVIWSYSAFGFHLTNNVIHSLNVLLVFLITTMLVEWGDGRPWSFSPGKKAIVAGAVTALLFGVHPLRVESVAWISERKDVLYGFFFLLSVLFYLKWLRPASATRRAVFYGAAVVSFGLSLLSKPMAVMLPVVLVILDFCPLKRLTLGMFTSLSGTATAIRISIDKIPFFLMSLVVGLITMKLNRAGGALLAAEFHGKSSTALVAVRGYMSYLYSTLFPSGLAPMYQYPDNMGLSDPIIIISIISFLAVTGLGIALIRTRGYVLAGWAYYLASLLPVITVASSADRFSYLPIVGPMAIVGILGGALYERTAKKEYRALLVACIIGATAVYSCATIKQTAIWKDTLTLWNHQIATYPDKVFRVYYNRGLVLAKMGEYEKALQDYNKAFELNPYNVRAADLYSSRGYVYMKMGDLKAALDDYNRAVSFNPRFVLTYMNRANLYAMLEKHEEAVRDFSTFIAMKPGSVHAHMQRGNSYARLGNLSAAAADYETVLKLSPKNGEAYYRLALVYSASGNQELALKGLKAAAGLGNPNAQAALKKIAERRAGKTK